MYLIESVHLNLLTPILMGQVHKQVLFSMVSAVSKRHTCIYIMASYDLTLGPSITWLFYTALIYNYRYNPI